MYWSCIEKNRQGIMYVFASSLGLKQYKQDKTIKNGNKIEK
jgi:hypothetical protein